ncbi:MAG: DUF2723 domain-containing protein [Deltaproteobacteria bacterium]|nr:DUF2723 domain-containing protein [Deltaproteobacteria bacterium]
MTILGTPAAVLGLATLLLYALIAPSTIVEGDNAELASLGALGGAAHPTGYPLYVLWLRTWSWLPGTPAHAAALATGLLTAIEAVLLVQAAKAWGARPLAGAIAAALVVTSPVVLRVQSQAEVFALNGCVAAAVLWLAAAHGPVRGARRVGALALIAGLGLSNHLTCAFVAPIGLLGVVRGVRESSWRALGAGVAGLLVGLAPYAYLLVAPSTPASWGKISSLSELAHHVLRMDYGGPGQLSPHGEHVPITESLLALAATLGRAFLWLPLAAIVFAWRRASRAAGESRAAWAAWLASFLIAGPLFVARFNLRPVGLELYTVSRFHLLPMVLLAVPVAVGLDAVAEQLFARVRLRVAILVAAAVFVGGALLSVPQVARYHTACVQRSLENTLGSLPDGAVLIGTQDILHFGSTYVQAVLGERRDVTVIMTPQVGLAYYRERVRAKLGIDLDTLVRERPAVPSVRIAELVLATGRPLFIDQFQANIAKSFPVYPYGAVFRVLPTGTPLPSLDELFALNKKLYAAMRFDYASPNAGDDLAAQAHQQYAATWRALADGLTGEPQAYARAMVDALAPR